MLQSRNVGGAPHTPPMSETATSTSSATSDLSDLASAHFTAHQAVKRSRELSESFDQAFDRRFGKLIVKYNDFVTRIVPKLTETNTLSVDWPNPVSRLRIPTAQGPASQNRQIAFDNGKMLLVLGSTSAGLDLLPLDVLLGSDRDISSNIRQRFARHRLDIAEAEVASATKDQSLAKGRFDIAKKNLEKAEDRLEVAQARLRQAKA